MGELIIKNDDLAMLTNNKGLGDVIKPLVKEIHLFDNTLQVRHIFPIHLF